MAMRKMLLFLMLIVFACSVTGCGIVHTKPSEPGQSIMDDSADLFSGDDEREIKEVMDEFAEYGNVCVYTTSDENYSTSQTAKKYYDRKFGNESGLVFIIDMYNRVIWVETDGYIGDVVDRNKALTIVDNVYNMARDGEYKECAIKALDQALRLMKGKMINQSMRIVSAVFVAILCALLLNFLLLRRINRKPEVSVSELSLGVKSNIRITNERVEVTERSFKTAKIDKANLAITILRILLIILTHGGGGGGSSRSGGSRHSSHGGGHRF